MKTEFGFMTLQNDATCQPRIQPSCVTHKWGESFRQKTHNSKIGTDRLTSAHILATFVVEPSPQRIASMVPLIMTASKFSSGMSSDVASICFPVQKGDAYGDSRRPEIEKQSGETKKRSIVCAAPNNRHAQTTYMSVRLCRQVWRSSGQ